MISYISLRIYVAIMDVFYILNVFSILNVCYTVRMRSVTLLPKWISRDFPGCLVATNRINSSISMVPASDEEDIQELFSQCHVHRNSDVTVSGHN